MSEHTFHIPVMGTGFSIDTPLHVARYGIDSVISLVDDVLMEQMRKFHAERAGRSYEPITESQANCRARRITAYLNLLNELIKEQVDLLKQAVFEKGTEITKYFELLPVSQLKEQYVQMLQEKNPLVKRKQQDALREAIQPGRIDVNVMTKLDRDRYENGEPLPLGSSDALTALEGFANSDLESGIVLSAGFNPRLYNYFTKFKDFFPDALGRIKKQVILKVSDYRSAEIQGKYLAKHGLWVSEYRIESAINCGGHAFVRTGELMGPVLEQFKQKKDELVEKLRGFYKKSLKTVQTYFPDSFRITTQGGLGTAEEHQFLLDHYQLASTGWGTPFMTVPEVVNICANDLDRLLVAAEGDVHLSTSSPLEVPFWTLKTSPSEIKRLRRIQENKPGAPCVRGFAKVFNTEFTKKPICIASRQYQKLKLAELESQDLTPEVFAFEKEKIMSRACICHDLAGNATMKYGIDPKATPAITCGPNMAYFSKVSTLKEMVNHIYGFGQSLVNENRPHMFLKEIQLHIDYLKNELRKQSLIWSDKMAANIQLIKKNMLEGIEYYQNLAKDYFVEKQALFLTKLAELKSDLDKI